MRLVHLLRTLGASAAAGALTFVATPAAAQEQTGNGRFREADAPEQAQDRREAREERRAQQTERLRQWQEAQAQGRPVREWSRPERSDEGSAGAGRTGNRRGPADGDWNQARAAQAQARAEARAQARAQAQAQSDAQTAAGRRYGGGDGERGRWERNRGYADENRNRTYRDGYRDGVQRDAWRDRRQEQDAYRSGYRDGWRADDRYDRGRYDERRGWDGGRDHRRWSHDWRRDHRYNWHRYRNANRHIFRLGTYYAPYRDYRYSRLGVGFRLGSLFYSSRYWINDPWHYRLPPAYGPYRWVRYYDDALLVDIYSGQVVDVIYDVFW